MREQAGLSDFTAAMLRRGTERRSFEQINEAVESVGASLSVNSGRHAIAVGGKTLAEDFGLLLDVFADVLQRPVFPQEHVDKLRGQTLTALQERDNDTGSVASMLFSGLAYPADHPYGWPVEGYQETVSAFGRDQVVDFYRRFVGPSGAALVVVGDVDAAHAIASVQAALGGWLGQPPVGRSFPAVTRPASLVRGEKVMPGKTQTDIVLGVPAMRRGDPDYEAARLANTVLGRFGMMGRLGETVREQLGLAYYSYSTLAASKEPGAWQVIAGVNPGSVDRCLVAVDAELARLGTELVPDEELDDSKALLTGSLPLRLETNAGVAEAILDMVWYDLGLDYLQRYGDLVASISAEQIRQVVATYLRPGATILAIAGPGAE
jgi:zinc protease